MNINDVVRVQTGFKQTSQESKIGKKIAETVKDYNIIQELLGGKLKGKGKKGKSQAEKPTLAPTQASPAYNLSLSSSSGPRPPMWDGLWTKREPAMSDEEFEKAIVALALEYAEKMVEIGNSGKSASIINRELFNFGQEFTNGKQAQLEMLFISVVSPDRKAAYANADFTNSYSVYGNEKNTFGDNELMRWHNNSGVWSITPTDAEVGRIKKFTNLFMDTLKSYEAEHGITIPSTTISKTWVV